MKKGGTNQITAKQAIAATKGSRGFVTTIAKKLGVSRTYIYNLMKKYPTFAQSIADEREGMKDMAEGQLLTNIEDGKEASLIFYLKTQAKDRGYVERQEVSGPEGGPISIKQWRKDRDKTRDEVAGTLEMFENAED